MSEFYKDTIVKMITNKIADDVYSSLRDSDVVTLNYARPSIEVPRVAGVEVLYDKKMGEIVLRADIKLNGEVLGGSAIYSTKSIKSTNDAANIIEVICEELKSNLLLSLAEKKLTEMIG